MCPNGHHLVFLWRRTPGSHLTQALGPKLGPMFGSSSYSPSFDLTTARMPDLRVAFFRPTSKVENKAFRLFVPRHLLPSVSPLRL
jgi:hypothetical protein